MSRSGYTTDFDDPWDLIKWRGQVASAIRGKRGQRLLTELLAALDAMSDKRLIAEELETADGEMCALGVVGKARGLDMQKIDPEDSDQVAEAFDIARQLAAEIAFENDEQCGPSEDPAKRFDRMRQWVAAHIITQKEAVSKESLPTAATPRSETPCPKCGGQKMVCMACEGKLSEHHESPCDCSTDKACPRCNGSGTVPV